MIIGLSLAIGVTVFVLVAYFLRRNGSAPAIDPGLGRVMVFAWIGWSAIVATGTVLFWRARMEPLITGVQHYPHDRIGELTTNLIICWALIEGAALLGAVVYYLYGPLWVAIASVAMIWGAILMSRPQVEWFQRFMP